MKLYTLSYKRKCLRFKDRSLSAQNTIEFLKQKLQKTESQSQRLPILQRIAQEQDLLRYLNRKEIK